MTEQERDRLAFWNAAQSDADMHDLIAENNDLRAVNRELRGENDALQIRLAAALERGRKMRHHRPRDIRGLLALARDAMKGRTS